MEGVIKDTVLTAATKVLGNATFSSQSSCLPDDDDPNEEKSFPENKEEHDKDEGEREGEGEGEGEDNDNDEKNDARSQCSDDSSIISTSSSAMSTNTQFDIYGYEAATNRLKCETAIFPRQARLKTKQTQDCQGSTLLANGLTSLMNQFFGSQQSSASTGLHTDHHLQATTVCSTFQTQDEELEGHAMLCANLNEDNDVMEASTRAIHHLHNMLSQVAHRAFASCRESVQRNARKNANTTGKCSDGSCGGSISSMVVQSADDDEDHDSNNQDRDQDRDQDHDQENFDFNDESVGVFVQYFLIEIEEALDMLSQSTYEQALVPSTSDLFSGCFVLVKGQNIVVIGVGKAIQCFLQTRRGDMHTLLPEYSKDRDDRSDAVDWDGTYIKKVNITTTRISRPDFGGRLSKETFIAITGSPLPAKSNTYPRKNKKLGAFIQKLLAKGVTSANVCKKIVAKTHRNVSGKSLWTKLKGTRKKPICAATILHWKR